VLILYMGDAAIGGQKIETAVEPKFQAHFVDAMALPHQTAPYPNLSKVVTLPAVEPVGVRRDRAARRARREQAN